RVINFLKPSSMLGLLLAYMVFEKLFRYPPVRPAPIVAGYGCEARLRGLDRAIPNYFLKLHVRRLPHKAAWQRVM
ncbi:MAG: hypothetical protein NZM94_04485, partial [Roseiflexus sp.]|nr:hypothetical protein [Roseiflexus sp.]